MNSLIVACGYYQYDMLNINNLFQNGIIMILIPPKLHKIFILCNYNTKIKLCQYFIPIIYLNKTAIGAHSEPHIFFIFKYSFVIRSKLEYLENLKHNLIKHFLPSYGNDTFQVVGFVTFSDFVSILVCNNVIGKP